MAGRVSNINLSIRSEMPEELLDPVNHEPMLDAVSLVPCGHAFSEKTAAELLNRRMVCPLGREEFKSHIPNYIVRILASKAINRPQEDQVAPSPPEGPPPKAVTHLERGKELYAQEKYDEAILACIAALSLYPTYEKAEAYLSCALDAQKKSLSLRQNHSAPSNHPLVPSIAFAAPSDVRFQPIQIDQKPPNASKDTSSLNSLPENLESSCVNSPTNPSAALPMPLGSAPYPSQIDLKTPMTSNAAVTGIVPQAPYLEFALNRVGRGKALCKAVEEGREDIVRYLLAQDTDVNAVNNNKTPLRVACEKNNVKMLQLLIGNGAQADGEDAKNALIFALENGFKEIVRVLVENGAPMMEEKGPKPHKVREHNETPCLPLQIAIRKGDVESLKVLLKTIVRAHGVKLDAYHSYLPSVFGSEYEYTTVGGHAFLLACDKGDQNIAQLLLDAGVRLDSNHSGNEYAGYRRTLGDSAFIKVCDKGNEDFVQFILKKGIVLDKVFNRNPDGSRTTLRERVLRAVEYRFPKIYQLIKEAPCRVF